MVTITRARFREELGNGIDLHDPALAETGVGVSSLRAADANGDGVVAGRELDAAFRVVDDLDRDGRRDTFLDAGAAGGAYHALLASRRARPDGGDIVRAARALMREEGAAYAREGAPRSPLAGLSGNWRPGETRVAWLEGRSKCNQFVGDVLTQAGVIAPTVTMGPGQGVHYARVEAWAGRGDLFERIGDPRAIRPGDLIVRDYVEQTGDGGGHVEVVTGVGPLRSAGAHRDGAYERPNDWLEGASYDPVTRTYTDRDGNAVYVLRARLKLPGGTWQGEAAQT